LPDPVKSTTDITRRPGNRPTRQDVLIYIDTAALCFDRVIRVGLFQPGRKSVLKLAMDLPYHFFGGGATFIRRCIFQADIVAFTGGFLIGELFG
jgi:hypothetical protein